MAQLQTSQVRNQEGSPYAFFVVTLALTLPLWIAGSLSSIMLLPGLPLSSLMVICPVSAGVILRLREAGTAGAAQLLKRAFDVCRIRSAVWIALALLLQPAVYISSYAAMRLLATPMPSAQIGGLTVVTLFVMFFVAALGEELGWMGYAYAPLEKRWGAAGAAIVIGVVWAAWHLIPFFQAERSLSWIAWQSMYLLGSRVLIVWIFKNTGRSVFAAALFHATGNLSWQLFPVQGSLYDPRSTALLVAALAVGIVAFAGPRRLTRASTGNQAISERQCGA